MIKTRNVHHRFGNWQEMHDLFKAYRHRPQLDESYKRLQIAIVRQAVDDWRGALYWLVENKPRYRVWWSLFAIGGGKAHKKVLDECEAFFCSEWFESLTNGAGDAAFEKLKAEAKEADRIALE